MYSLLPSLEIGLGSALLLGLLACAPPPAIELPAEQTGITLLTPGSDGQVELTREGPDLYLDLALAVDINGLEFVPPEGAVADVDGQGHFRFGVDGARVTEPGAQFFRYRSSRNQYSPGDSVRLSVNLVSNTGQDLAGLANWLDEVELELTAPEFPTAEFRFIHAAPDAGLLDIYLDGDSTPALEGVAFGEAGAWLEVEATPLRVELRPAGASASSEPLLTEFLDPQEGQRISGVAGGFTTGVNAGSLQVVELRDDWGNDVAGRARARFVHAGSDMPTIRVQGPGESSQLTPFSASPAAGVTLDIDGGVPLELLGPDGSVLTSFTSPELSDGDEILFIATGSLDSLARETAGLRLLAIGPDGPLDPILQDPQLFVLHASGDSGSLELCSDTNAVAANLFYSDMVPVRVQPGTYDLQLFNYPAGCTGTPLNGSGNTTTFQAGQRYLTLLTGEQTADPGEASIQAASFLDDFTLGDPDNAKVRFVHGASYTQVYVGVVAGGSISATNVLTKPIAWRSASVEVSVGAGEVLLGIADAVGEPPPPYTPIVTFDYAALGGERQWGIVAGDPTPDDADDSFLEVLVVDSAPSDWTVAVVPVQ